MIAIGISATPIFIRLTRAQVACGQGRGLRRSGARAVGNSHLRIAVRHILPNVIPPLVVQATLAIAAAVIARASLSFLGWGSSRRRRAGAACSTPRRNYVENAPWMAVWPGVSIFLLVLSFTCWATRLRDALDPRHA